MLTLPKHIPIIILYRKGGDRLSAKERANTEKVIVFLPPDILEELKEIANETGSSVSGTIRTIIFERLKERSEEKLAKK